jgi:DNA-binding NtrC family response regulator
MSAVNGEGARREGRTPPRILVVEAAAILALMVDALTFEGYDIYGTLDAAEAARLITGGTFDVVVSDLVIPGTTGLTLLDTAKRCTRRTPLILVSGYTTSEDVMDAARRGAFRVLRKPFPPRLLIDAVREALSPHA